MKIHIVNTLQNLTSQLTKRVRKHCISYYEVMFFDNKSLFFVHSSLTVAIACVVKCQDLIVFSQRLDQDPMGLTNADNAFTLYYVKFRAAAPKVRVSTSIYDQPNLCCK